MRSEPVVLINAFEVPVGEDEAFLEEWQRGRDVLSRHEGYISTRLHRSLTPTADFRFVNVALWDSPEAFRAATTAPEFADRPHSFRFHVSLYEVVYSDG